MKTLLVTAILFVLTACNTVHKTATTTTEKSNSISVVKKDNTAVRKSDSTGTKTEAGNYEKETVYQFDTVYQVVKGDTVLKYVPRILKVLEKGNYNNQETAQHSNYDSAAAHEIDSAMKHEEAKTVVKQKTSSRMPVGLIIAGVVAFALVLLFIYFKRK